MAGSEGLRLGDFVDLQQSVNEMATKKIAACSHQDNVMSAVGKFLDGAKMVSVINNSGVYLGFITPRDIMGFLSGLYMKKLSAGLMTKARTLARPTPAFQKKHNIGRALEVFKKLGKEHHPVLLDNKITGIISERDFVKYINKPTGIRVDDLMVRKPFLARESYSLNDLSKMMYHGYARMPVERDGILIGMVTPFDVISHLYKRQKLSKLKEESTTVNNFMNRNPIFCQSGWEIHRAIQTMRGQNVSALPVVEDEFHNLVGIITQRDIVDALS
jgi:predicted transcriptional regulator